MADARITAENNGFRYGLLTAAVLIVYTLIAVLADFFRNMSAGALDLVILAVGVILAIMNLKRAKDDRLPYLQGFGTGIITAMVASIALGFFFIILSVIKPDILQQLTRARDLFGSDLSVVIAFLAIILMGSMGGMIISLVAMQYFKSPDHKPMEGVE
ncbi:MULTISPECIES: DUF4199 domain-containing protein [Hymenobacter]|uniref:DUF4199 domain-containing protein n=1 Tax=Hymenobacter jejuensis TaxID=2502781 RepID=A0A5B8A5Y1_9BACT|nr:MULTISPECIES: DUF4199 domain-containing protein [Hymenobacter]MBC6990038.1 DUF4199 domain-containing protein [Hymenobacter sp. BT491]QDA62066.1 DUF4199 domain-containing protein [Hymenobacter jejuensis]